MDLKVLNHDEMLDLVFDKERGLLKDPTVFKRIRYFSEHDFNYSQKTQVKPIYFVLLDKEKIVAVAKIGYYSLSAQNEKTYSVSFLSIDKNYRGFKYSRILVNAIFKYAKENDLEMSTSAYTVLGKESLKHLFNEYAKKYDVTFYDREDMHDAEWMYVTKDGRKYHKSEIEESVKFEGHTIDYNPHFLKEFEDYKVFYKNFESRNKKLMEDLEESVEMLLAMIVEAEDTKENRKRIWSFRNNIIARLEYVKSFPIIYSKYIFNENRCFMIDGKIKTERDKNLEDFNLKMKLLSKLSAYNIVHDIFKNVNHIYLNMITKFYEKIHLLISEMRQFSLGISEEDYQHLQDSILETSKEIKNIKLPEFIELPALN